MGEALRTRTLISIENILKGVFLGLLSVAATRSETVAQALGVFSISAAALVVALVFQSFRQRRNTKRSRGHLLASIILALLDNPATVFAFIVGGYAVGELYWQFPLLEIVAASGAGAVVGVFWDTSLKIRQVWPRRLILLTLGISIVAGIAALFHYGLVDTVGSRYVVALTLVLGAVLFYVLTFAGRGEETEPEIAVICAGIALALAQLHLPYMARGLIVIVPMAVFVVYCERIRRHLVVFKHVLRGLSHEQEGDLRNALFWYRQALQRNPKSELAVAGNWRVHRKIDLASLAEDDEIVKMIDPIVCLDRARSLLSKSQPSEVELEEAGKLLDIVQCRRQDLPQTIGHERLHVAVLARDGQTAMGVARQLVELEPPAAIALPDHELDALFRTWSKLLQDPLLVSSGGPELLNEADYLFRFLATLESRLRQAPQDQQAQSFKAFVYDKLSLELYENYLRDHEEDSLDWLDYRFCHQKARLFATEGEPARAVDFLRIAEMGLPHDRLILWTEIAELHAQQQSVEATTWYERVKDLGMQLGPKQLADDQAKPFYRAVRVLGERAIAEQRWQDAIENFQILADWSQTGIATLETLKDLYEKTGDTVLAIRPVEIALQYSLKESQRKQWAAEKARLYAAVTAEMVTPKLSLVGKYFDFNYCYRRAKRLFEEKQPTEDIIHFLDLAALGGERFLLNVNYLLGRSYYRQGNIDDAVLCLEQVKSNRPAHFDDDEQKDAYYSACRLLGDLYLDQRNEPAKAVECYSIYKDYTKSGAETLYRLGCAYEANGQPAHARKWYDMVLVYPGHPRAEDAKRALAKLGDP